MLRNLIIALSSSVVFSLILTLFSYTPVLNRFPNSDYPSLGNYLVLFLLYSIPVYIVASFIFGYIIKILNRKFNTNNKYSLNLIWYGGAGIITGVTFLFFTKGDFYILPFLILCIAASLIFYHLSILFKRIGF